MKRFLCSVFVLVAVFAALAAALPAPAAEEEPAAGGSAVVVEKERGVLNWTQNYIESSGVGVVPKGSSGAQAKALARRGAIVDLQRNLLEFMRGVQIDGRTTLDNFMADDLVRSEVSGMIKNVELLDGEWDGESYTMHGRIKLPQIRVMVASAPAIKQEVYGAGPDITINIDNAEPEPTEAPKKAKYTGLIIDARHLQLVPSMTFNVYDGRGKPVYGMNFVKQENYLQSGLCAYYNNINYAKGEAYVASNPIVAKAVRLASGNVDIVISNADAGRVRASSYDFRRECKVIVVCR
ncbi:MAG: hypothetical protein LBR38_09555 [Synergistaceae bacterium]|jgi:hypothetical protein|nr:hypothetical protein [Synergistaceae bacterium]